MNRRLVILLSSALLSGAALVAVPAPAGAVATKESATMSSATNGIALGPDGNYWVAQQFNNSVQRVTAAGALVGTPIAVGGPPIDVVAGPGNTMWVSVPTLDKLVKIPTNESQPTGTDAAVTGGSDCGPVALANLGNGKIAFSTPSDGNGCVHANGLNTYDTTTSTLGTWAGSRGQIFDMVVGGGKLYAPDYAGDVVRRISASTMDVETTVSVDASNPDGITVLGSAVWVTLNGTGKLATFPVSQNAGSATTVTPSVTLSSPFGIAPSHHGTLYVASKGNAKVVDVAVDGSATAITLPAGAEPWAMEVVANDGVLVTDQNRTKLTKISDAAPSSGTPTVTITSAGSVKVSAPVDSHGNATTVKVEYGTAGAYKASSKVPSAATLVTIGYTPASAGGPVNVTGEVTGFKPGSSYRLRMKVSNSRGENISSQVTFKLPKAPKTNLKAKVGPKTTALTKLEVKGLLGTETVKVTCKTPAKGCPFGSKTIGVLKKGGLKLTSFFSKAALAPGAKVTIAVTKGKAKLSTTTVIIRDGEQPKVKRK